ncbi:hypothetical protein [Serratia microhaemolytica]|uniref:hypothetical protein n=1 Tax=Serratia microhaemolytica TaxID=2675110 RepID=UPI000FDD1C5A|nr:hypothetical protein [Serratia microhaemolytica]
MQKVALLLCGWLSIVAAHAEETKVIYRSAFDIKYLFCNIKTNGVVGQNNRDSAVAGRGFGTGSTGAMLFMENGENEISVEISALNWFNEKLTDMKEKNSFNPSAYCKLDLVIYNPKNPARREKISSIAVTIDEKGLPTAATTVTPAAFAAINQPITVTQRIAPTVVPGFVRERSYAPNWFPKEMVVYEFSRKVTVNGVPEWPWVNATPYTDTPEQRQLLQQAYQEVWQAMQNKDIKKLKQLFAYSGRAFAYVTSSTEERVLNEHLMDITNGANFKMQPINWQGFEARIMNKGRMVRLVNRSDFDLSPLLYSYGDDIGATLAPYFSLINGRFVIVI